MFYLIVGFMDFHVTLIKEEPHEGLYQATVI